MANKNTRRARKAGFASRFDQLNNGTKTFKGGCCNTQRPEGKDKWIGAERAARRQGAADE